MRGLVINATKRAISTNLSLYKAPLNEVYQIRILLNAEKLSSLGLSDGSILYFDESHLEHGNCAFTFEDGANEHLIFGRAIYIPIEQEIKSKAWKYKIDPYVMFYNEKFSRRIKTRIADKVDPILLDERCLGKPVYRESKRNNSAGVASHKLGFRCQRLNTKLKL